ncbi:Hypothetical predicted protein [Cloeon dipterum]|uniref:EGF-like domain-containing protein n=1 Tax=Cloeon dipterum TaxID=197152 RepID=A0A8S1E402_9INSE|nr:Hypothetical predicted protein [Cloeon dipterum]
MDLRILILMLSAWFASCVDFSPVYEWHKLDFAWPSQESRQQAVNQSFKQEQIQPRYMAASGDKLFFSLRRQNGFPSTLVWLPTDTASKSPNLNPFPSWQVNASTNDICSGIRQPKTLQVDTKGRLWALDDGDKGSCPPKLWIFHVENESVAFVHQFPDGMFDTSTDHWKTMNDMVLDEYDDDILAYIADGRSEQLVMFSLSRFESWSVETGRVGLQSIALSSNSRLLYSNEFRGTRLFSISVDDLRSGKTSVELNQIGDWTSRSVYSMISDSDGVLYSAFYEKSFIHQFDSRDVFKEESFHDEGKTLRAVGRMFSFALDDSRNFWLMVVNEIAGQKFYKLIKTSLATKPISTIGSQTTIALPELDFCKENSGVCKNGGVCVSLSEQEGKYLCDCAENSFGQHCEVLQDTPVLLSEQQGALRPGSMNTVFEWDKMDFDWPSEKTRADAVRDGSYYPGKLPPFYLAAHGNRIFLSFSRYEGVPVTLASLPMTNALSVSPKLNPYPSWLMQKKGYCSVLQDIRGLAVDSLGRLWAVDNGQDEKCRPKLWIFNLGDNDRLERVHEFPEHVVRRRGPRWLTEIVLDESPDDTLAYIADSPGSAARLVVFSFNQRRSWRVPNQFKDMDALAISPLNLYIGGTVSNEVRSVPLKDLRTGARYPAVMFVGNKTAPSRRMAMDRNGKLFFDLVMKKSIATWNTNSSLAEDNFYTDVNVIDHWPFLFAFDELNNLWMMTIISARQLKYKMFKVEHGTDEFLSNTDADLESCRLCENDAVCVSLSEQEGHFRCECAENFKGHLCETSLKQKQEPSLVRVVKVDPDDF